MVFPFRELSQREEEDTIHHITTLLSNLPNLQSDVQLVNSLQEMAELNVTLDVLRVTGAGRMLEKMSKHQGEVGELAALLVDKWKRNVIKEQQRRIEIAQKELPDEFGEAHVEIFTTVTACGSSGYETLGQLGLAIINQEEADWYQLLLFRPKQSIVTVVNISSKFIFLVHQNNYMSIKDDDNSRWQIRYDSQDDLNDFARELLLLKAVNSKEEVVSTDLVIGEGRGAELGDSLEVQMVVWEVRGKNLTYMIENTRWKGKCIRLTLGAPRGDVGGSNRLFSLKEDIVGMKKGGRRFLIAWTNNRRTAYDLKITNLKAVNASASTATAKDDADEQATPPGRNEYATTTDDATAEDDADEHATAPGSVREDHEAVVETDSVGRDPPGNKRKSTRDEKAEEIAAKNANVQEALAAYKAGRYKSRRQCAEAFGVPEATLRKASKIENYVFKGPGRKLEALTEEEERKIKDHVIERLKLGVGLDLYQVQDLIQELLMGVVDANPERYVPWGDNPDSPYRPPDKWVRRFLKRHNLKYRSSMHINDARARVTREELELWFEDVREILSSDPELVEAMADPSRVFNWVSASTLSVVFA